MKMHQLPNELYEQIFVFCNTPDLFTLTLVDRRISCVANPLLYRKIQTLHSLSKIVQLLSTLLFFDQTAPLVQSLRVDFVWWSASLSKPIPRKDIYLCVKKVGTRKTFAAREVLNTYFSLLSAVLCKMGNLRNLELIFEHVESIDQTFGYLVKGFPSQLQSLTTSFQLGPALGQFLETQYQLRELRLGNHVPYPTQFLDDLPVSPLSQVTMISWSMKTPMDAVRYLAERASLNSIIVDLTASMFYYSTTMDHYFDIGDASKEVEHARIEFGPAFKKKCIPMILDSIPSLKTLNMILDTVTEENLTKILTSPSESNVINRVVITGYYSKVSVQESSILSLVRNFFGKWEYLEHLEIAVTSNRSVWHSCYEKVVGTNSTELQIKHTLEPWVYVSHGK